MIGHKCDLHSTCIDCENILENSNFHKVKNGYSTRCKGCTFVNKVTNFCTRNKVKCFKCGDEDITEICMEDKDRDFGMFITELEPRTYHKLKQNIKNFRFICSECRVIESVKYGEKEQCDCEECSNTENQN